VGIIGSKCGGDFRCKSGALLDAAGTCGEGETESGVDSDRSPEPGLLCLLARSGIWACFAEVTDREVGGLCSLGGKLKPVGGAVACGAVMGGSAAGKCVGAGK